MTANKDRRPSCITALHTRFEQATAELVAVSNAADRDRNDGFKDETSSSQRAMTFLGREIDALRMALLYQVPDTWREAMMLQFHIVGAFAAQVDFEVPKIEIEVLQVAIDTLFDFMCCETDEDHEAIGPDFRTEAVRVFFQRRMRTGVVEA